MQKCISDFLNVSCSKISSKYIREAVRSELATHLLDKTEELTSSGFTEEEAARVAVEAMGEPEELGSRLYYIYRPDYDVSIFGFILFVLSILWIANSPEISITNIIDFNSLLQVSLVAVALLLIGGCKGVSAEGLLKRFTKTAICSGIIWSLLYLAYMRFTGELFWLWITLSPIMNGAILSILAYAIIPTTPTARLRKMPVSAALSTE